MLMYDVEVFRYRSVRKCGWIGVLIACELRVVEFPAKLAGKASRLLGKPAGNFGAGSTLQLETSRNLSKLGPLKQQPFCL